MRVYEYYSKRIVFCCVIAFLFLLMQNNIIFMDFALCMFICETSVN